MGQIAMTVLSLQEAVETDWNKQSRHLARHPGRHAFGEKDRRRLRDRPRGPVRRLWDV